MYGKTKPNPSSSGSSQTRLSCTRLINMLKHWRAPAMCLQLKFHKMSSKRTKKKLQLIDSGLWLGLLARAFEAFGWLGGKLWDDDHIITYLHASLAAYTFLSSPSSHSVYLHFQLSSSLLILVLPFRAYRKISALGTWGKSTIALAFTAFAHMLLSGMFLIEFVDSIIPGDLVSLVKL